MLLTTANFPDIMLAAYEYNRWLAFYFVSFLIFGLFLFMQLLLAIFYSNYKKRYEDKVTSFME